MESIIAQRGFDEYTRTCEDLIVLALDGTGVRKAAYVLRWERDSLLGRRVTALDVKDIHATAR